jgi:hypothetical protein
MFCTDKPQSGAFNQPSDFILDSYFKLLQEITKTLEYSFQRVFEHEKISRFIHREPEAIKDFWKENLQFIEKTFNLSLLQHALQDPLALHYLGIIHYLDIYYQTYCIPKESNNLFLQFDYLLALLTMGFAKIIKSAAMQMDYNSQYKKQEYGKIEAKKKALSVIKQQLLQYKASNLCSELILTASIHRAIKVVDLTAALLCSLQEKLNHPAWIYMSPMHKKQMLVADARLALPSDLYRFYPVYPTWLATIKHFILSLWDNLIFFLKYTRLKYFKNWIRQSELHGYQVLKHLYEQNITYPFKLIDIDRWKPMDLNQFYQLHCTSAYANQIALKTISNRFEKTFMYLELEKLIVSEIFIIASYSHIAWQHLSQKWGVAEKGVIHCFLWENDTWLMLMTQKIDQESFKELFLQINNRLAYLEQVKQEVFYTHSEVDLILRSFIKKATYHLSRIIACHVEYVQCEVQSKQVLQLSQRFQITAQLLNWRFNTCVVSYLNQNSELKKFCPLNYQTLIQQDCSFRLALTRTGLGKLLQAVYHFSKLGEAQPFRKKSIVSSGVSIKLTDPEILKSILFILQASHLVENLLKSMGLLVHRLAAKTGTYLQSYYLISDLKHFFNSIQLIQQKISKQLVQLAILTQNDYLCRETNHYFEQSVSSKQVKLFLDYLSKTEYLAKYTGKTAQFVAFSLELKNIIQEGEVAYERISRTNSELSQQFWGFLQTRRASHPETALAESQFPFPITLHRRFSGSA